MPGEAAQNEEETLQERRGHRQPRRSYQRTNQQAELKQMRHSVRINFGSHVTTPCFQ